MNFLCLGVLCWEVSLYCTVSTWDSLGNEWWIDDACLRELNPGPSDLQSCVLLPLDTQDPTYNTSKLLLYIATINSKILYHMFKNYGDSFTTIFFLVKDTCAIKFHLVLIFFCFIPLKIMLAHSNFTKTCRNLQRNATEYFKK